MNNVMNGKEVVEKIGITYPQLRYFVRKIDALPKKETSQGHEHDFSFRDLVYLKLASIMRSDGLGLDEINIAIKQVAEAWKSDNPLLAGVLTRIPPAKKARSSRDMETESELNDLWNDIKSVKSTDLDDDVLSLEKRPVVWLWTLDSEWYLRDTDTSEFRKFVEHIPNLVYSVSAVARDLSKGDQLELNLMSEVGRSLEIAY